MRNHVLGAFAILALAACGGAPPAPAPQRSDWPDPSALPVRTELPDPLVSFEGKNITTREAWERERKPELRALFEFYRYGRMPPPRPVSGTVRHTDPKAYGGKATLKEISLAYAGPDGPKLNLLLVYPNGRQGPAPVFFGLNFSGNHQLVSDSDVSIPTTWMRSANSDQVAANRATDKGRAKAVGTWAIEQSIDRGYADIFPDKADMNDGLFKFLFQPTPGQKSPGDTGASAITLWAWGLHRIVDYLSTQPELDKSRLAVTGHSRLGKTALLAAAFDDRIALATPHQAGCGGTAPSRSKNPNSESVKKINDSFPHWFDDHFKQFNDNVDRLPFDQHCLLALCAPRPVLYTNGVDDQWANPDGQFDMMRAASPVYRLYGLEGIAAPKTPELGKLVDSPLGFYYRTGGHVSDPAYWKVFLDFADRYFRKA